MATRLDGASSWPGGIDGNGIQVGKQFAEITAISSYSFVVTCVLLLTLKYIPSMHLRVSEEGEVMALDMDQFSKSRLVTGPSLNSLTGAR
jgi:Amt family ammonium transporter